MHSSSGAEPGGGTLFRRLDAGRGRRPRQGAGINGPPPAPMDPTDQRTKGPDGPDGAGPTDKIGERPENSPWNDRPTTC